MKKILLGIFLIVSTYSFTAEFVVDIYAYPERILGKISLNDKQIQTILNNEISLFCNVRIGEKKEMSVGIVGTSYPSGPQFVKTLEIYASLADDGYEVGKVSSYINNIDNMAFSFSPVGDVMSWGKIEVRSQKYFIMSPETNWYNNLPMLEIKEKATGSKTECYFN